MADVRSALWVGAMFAVLSGAPRPARAEDPAAVYQVNLPLDLAVIGAGALGGIIPYALASDLIHPSCPCSASSVNAFDRGAIGNHSDAADWVSTATVGLTIAVPPVADWLAVRRGRVWLDDMVVFAEALSVNGALVTLAKYTVQRPIPRAYSDPAVAATVRSYRSFYSGHASFAFAALSTAAVTVNLRYGLTWEPWALTVLIGGSVAVERVVAGYHFPSDVLVGAAAGALVGAGVPLLHARRWRVRVSGFRPEVGTGAGITFAGVL